MLALSLLRSAKSSPDDLTISTFVHGPWTKYAAKYTAIKATHYLFCRLNSRTAYLGS